MNETVMSKNFSATIKFKEDLVQFHFCFNGTESIPIYKVHTEDRSLDFLMVKNEEKFEIIPLTAIPDSIKSIEDELSRAIYQNAGNPSN